MSLWERQRIAFVSGKHLKFLAHLSAGEIDRLNFYRAPVQFGTAQANQNVIDTPHFSF
jgi:hypothetical protein